LEENQAYFEFCQPILDNFFSPRLSAKMVDNLPQLINDLNTYPHLNYFSENSRIFQSYHSTLIENLENVIRLAQKEFEETGKKTESLKTFKKHFLKKDKNKQNRLKDDLNIAKNFSLCDVYQQYQDWLAYQNYYDFEDMLLEVAQKMSLNPDLKYTLQERFQFVMVDEFQDTSAGQMAIINQLVDYENPNLMVVGDDDQSVFKFQGASLDNILGFEQNFEQVKVVVLDKNYRSSQQILDFAKAVVEQIEDRLTNRLNIQKPLISAKK
jgi:DNA helicase-2/ATP-dependent DNA helicase PcrA